MGTRDKSWADILKAVSGPYQVMGLLLLVVESLLGYWLHKAGGAPERVFAGSLMTLVLLAVLYVVATRPKTAQTGLSIKPPDKKEVTPAEVVAPAPELMAGPDRSYLINRPPDDWKVDEVTMADWVSGALGVTDPAAREKLFPSTSGSREILLLDRGRQTSVIPVAGRTTVNGRKVPSALETFAPTQLTILPIERYQPPFFAERPLEDSVLTFVGSMLNVGTISATHLESGILSVNGRHYVACELQQKVQDAIVNGKEGENVVLGVSVIGIQGELHDHLLIMKYTISQGDPELDRNFETLRGLVASFRPVKPANTDEEHSKIKALAEENFNKFMKEHGHDMFYAELGVLLLRLQGVDLEDPETRGRVIKQVKPFESFARDLRLHDAELGSFWDALHLAEKGDATTFKTMFSEMLTQAVARQEQEKQVQNPALPPATGQVN